MTDPLLSVNEYVADGVQTEFNISFAGGYLSRDHVTVFVISPDETSAVDTAFTWVGATQISIVPAPTAGYTVKIYRETPFDQPLVNFSDGSVINEQTLDLNANQAVFLAAELRDRIGTIPGWDEVLVATTNANAAADSANTLIGQLNDYAFASTLDIIFTGIGSRVVDLEGFYSSGYNAEGVGAGWYIADSLANAGLAAAHPRFCKASSNGVYYRLFPVDGVIRPEQGGAVGDPTEANATNDQPAFQAALDYAYAIGVKSVTLELTQRAYSLWMPVRTSAPRSDGAHAADGHGLVVLSDQQLAIVGKAGAIRPRCNWRAYGGGSFDGAVAGTNWYLVADPSYPPTQVWRGNGVFLRTTNTDPGEGKRSSLKFENIIWNGGTACTHDNRWPANVADGSGWDITHKGIYAEADRRYGGDITVIHSEIVGWRGESIYTTNNVSAVGDERSKLIIRNCYFAESNGQGLNPNGANCDIDGAYIENCVIGIEGWTGDFGSRIVHTVIRNCYSDYGSTGGACTMQGGRYGSPTFDPTRIDATIVPIAEIDITFIDCSTGYLGSWLTGRIVCIDTQMFFGGGSLNSKCRETSLDCTFITDKTNLAYPRLGGNGAGLYGINGVNLKINHIRSSDAVTNGFQAPYAIEFSGSIGDNVAIDVQGTRNCSRPWASVSTVHDYAPSFTGDVFQSASDINGYYQNVETTPALAIRGPVVAVVTTNAGIFDISLPTTKIKRGQRMWLWSNNGTAGGIIRINGDETSGSGLRGNGDIYIVGGTGVELKFGSSYWEPVGKTLRKQRIVIPFADQAGLLAVGTGKGYVRAPYKAFVVGVGGWVNTAQSAGAALTLDIMDGGVSILSTKITLDNTEKTSTTAAVAPVVSDIDLNTDAELRADITQVGTPSAIGGGVWLDVIYK